MTDAYPQAAIDRAEAALRQSVPSRNDPPFVVITADDMRAILRYAERAHAALIAPSSPSDKANNDHDPR